MANIVGQISLFDMAGFLGWEPEKKPEPPTLLTAGQLVWLVKKGDVTEWTFTGENWICGDDGEERGYRLKGECYNCIWNKDIERRAFLEKSQADQRAETYLLTHQVIRKEEIQPIEVKAWSYIRGVDERRMITFYAILPDGKVYIKEFMTFHHIIDYGSVEKARKALEKRFMKQREFEYAEIVEVENPLDVCSFKNMYPCRKEVDWDYAESEYGAL